MNWTAFAAVIGALAFGVGTALSAYRIVANHLWHMEDRLTKQIEAIRVALNEHIKWHMEKGS